MKRRHSLVSENFSSWEMPCIAESQENSLVPPHLNTKEISLKNSVPPGMQGTQNIHFNLIDLVVTSFVHKACVMRGRGRI